MTQDLSLSRRVISDVTIIDASGMIVAENRKRLQSEVEELLLADRTKVALNFAEVSHFDSTGMGTVLLLTNLLKKRGMKLKIFAMQPMTSRFFKASGLHRILYLYNDEAQALADAWEV